MDRATNLRSAVGSVIPGHECTVKKQEEVTAAATTATRRKTRRRLMSSRFSVALALTITFSLLLAPFLLSIAAPTDAIGGEGECRATDDGSTVCDDDAGGERDDIATASGCDDGHESCAVWANSGECTKNPGYMLRHCRLSCGNCVETPKTSPVGIDDRELDELLRAVAEFGEPQRVEGADSANTLEVIRRTIGYMRTDVHGPNPKIDLPQSVITSCINRNELCAFWVAVGECDANPAFMVTNCAPSCESCHLIDFEARCPPLDPEVRPALRPGELNAMFERIVEMAPGNRTVEDDGGEATIPEGMPRYTVTVHSRPEPTDHPILSEESDTDQPPWVITFDNFVTDEECEHLIQLGYKHKYERSKDVGPQKFDGSFDGHESQSRTSENAWCSVLSGCRGDPVVQRIHNRLAKVTGVPADNSEDLQLLKYEVGQFYRTHHDYIGHQRGRQCGPRILTFFLYLSDVESGGATGFTDLNFDIKPKRGRALLWPSVFNHDPVEMDGRMRHEAKPVEKGTKFAANAWIHLYDYVSAQSRGCS